jgi:hypothetical protein
VTMGLVTTDGVGPHADLLDEFPYLGPPHPVSSPQPQEHSPGPPYPQGPIPEIRSTEIRMTKPGGGLGIGGKRTSGLHVGRRWTAQARLGYRARATTR